MTERPTLKPKDAPDLGRFLFEDAFRLAEPRTGNERVQRDAAHNFAQERLPQRLLRAVAEEEADPAIIRRIGLLDVTVPVEHGGPGRSYVPCGLIAREMEWVDSGYRNVGSVQSGLVLYPTLGGAITGLQAFC